MTHEIHLTAEEVAEACRQYANRLTSATITDEDKVDFDIAMQLGHGEEGELCAFRGATVRMGGGK